MIDISFLALLLKIVKSKHLHYKDIYFYIRTIQFSLERPLYVLINPCQIIRHIIVNSHFIMPVVGKRVDFRTETFETTLFD